MPADRPVARPVETRERVGSVDVIRGVALLGILAMNIVSFAWPEGVYSVPIRDPDAGRLDVALWAFNHLVFDTKMMSLFSMLFGAGLVLMSDRSAGRGTTARLGLLPARVLAARHRPDPRVPDLERRHPRPLRRLRLPALPVPQASPADLDRHRGLPEPDVRPAVPRVPRVRRPVHAADGRAGRGEAQGGRAARGGGRRGSRGLEEDDDPRDRARTSSRRSRCTAARTRRSSSTGPRS